MFMDELKLVLLPMAAECVFCGWGGGGHGNQAQYYKTMAQNYQTMAQNYQITGQNYKTMLKNAEHTLLYLQEPTSF